MFVHLALIVWYLHVYKVIGLNTSCCDSYHLKRQNGELWTCGNCHPGYHFADDCEFNGGSAKCSPCSDGYFMETRNVFRACRPCKNSCPHNTIIDFNCTSTSDLKCGCSNDKYLDKDVCVRKTKCQPGYGVSGTTAEGHTKCDRCPEGTISPNYSFDEKCMPDKDDCVPMPCMNNGTCMDLVDDFNCTCPRGISGRRCEHATGCDSQPCQNGGQCIPEGLLHLCDCTDGFKGPNCDDTCPTCNSNEYITVIIVLAVLLCLCAIVVIVLGAPSWLRKGSKRGKATTNEENPISRGCEEDQHHDGRGTDGKSVHKKGRSSVCSPSEDAESKATDPLLKDQENIVEKDDNDASNSNVKAPRQTTDTSIPLANLPNSEEECPIAAPNELGSGETYKTVSLTHAKMNTRGISRLRRSVTE